MSPLDLMTNLMIILPFPASNKYTVKNESKYKQLKFQIYFSKQDQTHR